MPWSTRAAKGMEHGITRKKDRNYFGSLIWVCSGGALEHGSCQSFVDGLAYDALNSSTSLDMYKYSQ